MGRSRILDGCGLIRIVQKRPVKRFWEGLTWNHPLTMTQIHCINLTFCSWTIWDVNSSNFAQQLPICFILELWTYHGASSSALSTFLLAQAIGGLVFSSPIPTCKIVWPCLIFKPCGPVRFLSGSPRNQFLEPMQDERTIQQIEAYFFHFFSL